MLLQEKADQAQALLAETGLDCWLTFVRETVVHPDPGVELVVGTALTWPSAFIFHSSGERIAIAGRYDTPNVHATGVFGEVIGYDEGIGQTLVSTLQRLDPQQIGLNYSLDDITADGLTHGMWLLLNNMLKDTPYALVIHCLGVASYWAGGLVAGRHIERDRDAEFRASGPVGRLVPLVEQAKAQLTADVAGAVAEAPPRSALDGAYEGPPQPLTQGTVLLHVLEELCQHHGQAEVIRDALLAEARASG